ncbi:granulin b [Hoplias malabaricus]|uniref:granulin b n=1 Tax=Hoplias malabaricus TaxID=27720 RepID=UPI0034628688
MREIVWLLVCVLSVCGALICPDGGMCDDGSTCCLTPSGGYGCCPLPNAECCSDHLHCCYEGTLCDLEHSKCVNKTQTLDWVKRVAPKSSSLPQAVKCPDQESECPDDTTCCQLPDGTWGCCPMPNAVCCEDKKHCCPQGTTCDIPHSKCVSPLLGPTPLKRKFPARLRTRGEKIAEAQVKEVSVKSTESNDVLCPDKQSTCPDGTTCCQLGNGSYGCCPMPNAVCCSDHMHCCPEGTSCDLVQSTCVPGNGIEGTATKMLSVFRSKATVNKVPCNDSVACEDGSTCCKKKDGVWACCPLPEAVCCEDHIHCCPEDTVCDLAEGTCDDPAGLLTSVGWMEKVPAVHRAPPPSNKQCDPTTTCPDGTTCCKMESGSWGCCPLPQAVCCEDHLHCCPHNTVCNVAAGTCDSVSEAGVLSTVPWWSKTPAVTLPPENDRCDETTACPAGTTCCRQMSGAWACCPLPQAVCCDDHEHCCPQGYKCDVAHETCEHPSLPRTGWFRKQPALLTMTQHSDAKAKANAESAVAGPEQRHKCDAQTSCPRDTTCCYMTKVNKWGCCPLPEAVCCGGGDHCCPKGYTCDEKKLTCAKGYLEIPWLRKQEAKVTQGSGGVSDVEDVKCDSTTSCPSGCTCCRLPTGKWGCCPHVKAVCCEDHEHCCPAGYTCDVQAGTCLKPFTSHTTALTPVLTHSGEELMCDAANHCSDTQTCCKTSDTDWACCPFKQAVCCKDMKHCCPKGYVCDSKTEGCTRVSSLTWWDSSL